MKEINIKQLFFIYLETKEKITNRPDAVIVMRGQLKGRSIYQTKMLNIKKLAVRLTAENNNEKMMLDTILEIKDEDKIYILEN